MTETAEDRNTDDAGSLWQPKCRQVSGAVGLEDSLRFLASRTSVLSPRDPTPSRSTSFILCLASLKRTAAADLPSEATPALGAAIAPTIARVMDWGHYGDTRACGCHCCENQMHEALWETQLFDRAVFFFSLQWMNSELTRASRRYEMRGSLRSTSSKLATS